MNRSKETGVKIFVVMPAFKSSRQIHKVLGSIGPEVHKIIIIDDNCPESTGDVALKMVIDPRIQLIKHHVNKGVGGAVCSGYRQAIEMGADVVVKIDSDGQMDPCNINKLVQPLLDGNADYSKGNRFFNVDNIGVMPFHRLIGNAGLSFFSKISTGYWSIFDPNNGFTAITSNALGAIPLEKISERYFFESDMLFRLNLAKAVVVDVPMNPIYQDEVSNLSAFKSIFEFTIKHSKNLLKRLFYNYFLREFSLASLQLIFGSTLLCFGFFFGLHNWLNSMQTGIPTETGALILIALTLLSGLQMILSFTSYDMSHEPKNVLSKLLSR
jgi:dolichol-phosphate mannosyltransferase